MQGRQRRRLVWGGIGALAVALLAWAWMPRPVPVDLARAERGPMAVTLDEEGETRVRERYVVSAPFAGRVLRIDLEPGDPVLAGTTVLATFLPVDPVPLDARTRAEATARVRAAETALVKHMTTRSGNVLQAIREKKTLDDAIKNDLNATLKDFVTDFTSAKGAVTA